MNQDSHISSSSISQSSYFEEVCCLILASPQKKLRGYIEFKKFDVTIKKNYKIQISLILEGLDRFSPNFVWNISVLVHSSTKFQLDNSKFVQVTQCRANLQKIQNLKKFERFNRFWPNLIPKVLDRYIMFVCNFRMVPQIFTKVRATKTFFRKFKIP